MIHQYNPFNDDYHAESLSNAVNLFTDKVQNMHGYRIDVGLYEANFKLMIDEEYFGNDVWRVISGLDVSIARAVGRDDTVERSIYLYPISKNAVVKQYGKMNIMATYQVIVVFVLIVLVILFFTTILNVFFPHENWEMYNVILILIFGQTTTAIPSSISERISFLFLILTSSGSFAYIFGKLVEMNYMQMVYLDLRTLNDIVHHKLIPYIPFNVIEIMNQYYYDDPVIQEVFHMQTSNRTLVKNNDEVQECFVSETVGRMLSYSHSLGENDWILSFIEEPIAPGLSIMIFTNNKT
ncbi:hypothetical protein TSAR_011141 [Trichomalopsis sarcophagae]|uniref:Ionotropic glutamate receptor L-glutamate and glycine-binding domain-containing protein n=1 Tax=Trichomalopsis sarcophagae TaxID=543379 RepID=A0A232FHJ7_9HYME|nr:hypothetical protein TSAR_011141 [Trichomalopsis sarcophagae]